MPVMGRASVNFEGADFDDIARLEQYPDGMQRFVGARLPLAQPFASSQFQEPSQLLLRWSSPWVHLRRRQYSVPLGLPALKVPALFVRNIGSGGLIQ